MSTKTGQAQLSAALAEMLRALSVQESDIASELEQMNHFVLAKTANRSVLGMMNDFAFQLDSYRGDAHSTVLQKEIFLARAPCSPLGMDSPDDRTQSLFLVPPLRVVFLDIDGVLNRDISTGPRDSPRALDPAAINRLNTIVEQSGAKVVITSTWRALYTRDRLQGLLAAHGFVGEVIGVTPTFLPFSLSRKRERGDEIATWLFEQPMRIREFVILDDRDDMGRFAHRLVRTRSEQGLQDEHVEQAIRLLLASA